MKRGMALAVPVRAAPSPFPPSCVLCYSEAIFIIIIIYPLTARVVGAPQMISQPISSIFPCSPLPSRTWRMQVCPFPDVVFPPLPLSALFPPPPTLLLCLARRFWPGLMSRWHIHTTAVCVSSRWSAGLRVVRLPAGSFRAKK